MELSVFDCAFLGTKTFNSGEIGRVKGEFLSEKPFLHLVLEKKGNIVCFCTKSRKFYVMDCEAFNEFGEKFLAKHQLVEFEERRHKFYVFAFAATSKCNLACTYCFGRTGERKGSDSSWPVIKAAIDFLTEGNDNIGLGFILPGEQTMNFQLFKKALLYAKEHLKIKAITLSTNGTGSPEDLAEIAGLLHTLQVSIDGPPEIQDRQRPLNGGGKSSKIAEKTIRALLGKGVEVQAKITITPLHFGKELDTFRYFKSLGVKRISVSVVTPHGLAEPYSEDGMRQATRSMLQIKELGEEFGMLSIASMEQLLGHKKTEFCQLGRAFNLGVDGKAAACSIYSSDFDVKIHKGMEKMVFAEYDKKAKKFNVDWQKLAELEEVHKNAECYNCDLKVCWGGCPYSNLATNGRMEAPDSYTCSKNKAEMDGLFKYLAEKYAMKTKPCIKEAGGKTFLSLQYTDFPLKKCGPEKLSGNPFIAFDPGKTNLEKFAEKIISYSRKNKKNQPVFVLSPACGEILDARQSVLFKMFLYKLSDANVIFKVSKPVIITDSAPEKQNAFQNEFSIPYSCLQCTELLTETEKGTVFCNGKAPKNLEKAFGKDDLYGEFKKSGWNPKCKNMALSWQDEGRKK
jgi:radical SAM protein with 4Fe4S-binding SPASM domain